MVIVDENKNSTSVTKEEIDAALDKIFNEVSKAISQNAKNKIQLERVDETLDALFQAVNEAQQKGKDARIPDFKRIMLGEF